MKYRITDLKNFTEIAGNRTMREGAVKLGITQPALSESIKRLEEDLGEVLFYRSRSGIALTPGGQKVLKKAQEIIRALDSLTLDDIQNDSRLITIGCHSTIASYFLPKAFRLIQKENPWYQVRLHHDLSRNIQLAVQQGQIDIGIVVNAVPVPDLIIKPLAKDEVCIWHSDRHGKNNFDKIFCNLSLFQTQTILRKWKEKPTNLVDTDSLELIARFVNDGLGYGIIPERMVNLLGLKSCKKLVKAPTFHDVISLVYRPEFGKQIVEKRIVENLKLSVESSD